MTPSRTSGSRSLDETRFGFNPSSGSGWKRRLSCETRPLVNRLGLPKGPCRVSSIAPSASSWVNVSATSSGKEGDRESVVGVRMPQVQSISALGPWMRVAGGLCEEGISTREARGRIDLGQELLHRPLVAGVDQGHAGPRHTDRLFVVVQVVRERGDSADRVRRADLARGATKGRELRERLALVAFEVLYGSLDERAREHDLSCSAGDRSRRRAGSPRSRDCVRNIAATRPAASTLRDLT